MQWPPLSAIFTVELPVEQGHAETRYSSWRLHKESFQEKGQEVGYKVWPTGLQERKEAPTGNAAATDSEKSPWERPRAFHMKVVAFDWWKWTTRLKLMTLTQCYCHSNVPFYIATLKSAFLRMCFSWLWERISLEGFDQLTWNFQCWFLLKRFLGWA